MSDRAAANDEKFLRRVFPQGRADLLKLSTSWAAIAARAVGRNVLSGFDIDEFGIARAELAQFSAYQSGIALLVE